MKKGLVITLNTYRIRYVKGSHGVNIVKADTVNGFKPESDTYVFKMGNEVVAVTPKKQVVSIEKIGESENVG